MIKVNGIPVQIEHFPNNESRIKDFSCLQDLHGSADITLNYETDQDLIHLMFVKAKLDDLKIESTLFISYMPYSRMDREIKGDLFTLKYMAQFIKTLNFKTPIVIAEPHSSETVTLLEDQGLEVLDIYPASRWMMELIGSEPGVLQIVFPDKGAKARYTEMHDNLPNLVTFAKNRDPYTGSIIGIGIDEGEVIPGSTCIIVDDLCSRGGTFLGSAQILKDLGAKRVILVVTHTENTIFGGNLLDDNSPVDMIITSDSMITQTHKKITIKSLDNEWRQ